MGLARGAIALLLEEARRRPYAGSIATLGRQTVYLSQYELAGQFEKFKIMPRTLPLRMDKPIDDVELFQSLGFDSLENIDYSNFEGATHVLDLNRDGMPAALRDRFDVVLDSGTIEHVFHIPNVMKNIVRLVKVGGRIIFLSPSSNHLDHGFYMFSPTFFVDYFLANRFEINTCYVVRYSLNPVDLWDVYQYEPDDWRNFQIGGLDANPYAIFFVATRTAQSTGDAIPQQGYYTNNAPFYAGTQIAAKAGAAAVSAAGAVLSSAPQSNGAHGQPSRILPIVKRVIRCFPGAYPIVQRIRRRVRIQGLQKKLVGRY